MSALLQRFVELAFFSFAMKYFLSRCRYLIRTSQILKLKMCAKSMSLPYDLRLFFGILAGDEKNAEVDKNDSFNKGFYVFQFRVTFGSGRG